MVYSRPKGWNDAERQLSSPPHSQKVVDQHFFLGAEDGLGLCDLESPQSTETPSVAFAFRTGEVWGIDTTILTYHPSGIPVGEIEKVYTARLVDYANFLSSIGPKAPYRWIAGISNVKGRRLQIPVPQGSSAFFPGPECLSENIIEEGTYDGKETPASALSKFFDAIYDECGSPRPKR
jgi:hypothetical protein